MDIRKVIKKRHNEEKRKVSVLRLILEVMETEIVPHKSEDGRQKNGVR